MFSGFIPVAITMERTLKNLLTLNLECNAEKSNFVSGIIEIKKKMHYDGGLFAQVTQIWGAIKREKNGQNSWNETQENTS